MKERRLLYAIGWVKDEYILEMQQRGTKQKNRKIPSRKIWLIAAVIAALLLLAGCVAVFLRLQDMSIGKETYTQYFDDQGRYIEPVEKEKDIITLTGYADSPTQKAFQEWYEFRESYDPNRELLTNEPNLPDIPDAEEAVYGCYTPEMVEKLHEIADRYGLQLLDVYTPIQKYQSSIALKALGVDTLLKPGAPAQMGDMSGLLYSPYNFQLEYDVTLDDGTEYLVVQYYHRNGYFPCNAAGYYDLSQWQQWDYTTHDGVKLLLALGSKGTAEIIADLGHGFMSIGFNSYDGPSLYPQPGEIITKEGLQQVAEVFAYDLPFQQIDAAAIQPELDAAEAKYREEHAYVPEVYGGFEEYMLENAPWFKSKKVYTFYDLNKDGEQELILGDLQGEIVSRSWVFSMQDGQLVDRGGYGGLCQENVTVSYNRREHSAEESWQYWKWDFTFVEDDGEYIGTVYHNADGTWQLATESIWPDEAPTVTQAEAEAFMDRFKPVTLDWQPVSDYPLSDGTTLGNYLGSLDQPLSQEELRQLYVDTFADKDDEFRTHYRLMDVNRDGMEEILISGDGETFWEIFSCKYGQIRNMGLNDVTLCENGVFERVCIFRTEPGVEIEEHEFLAFDGWNAVSLDYVCYNKATASWQTDLDGTAITEAEAQAILAKYTRIDQDMKPISELMTE